MDSRITRPNHAYLGISDPIFRDFLSKRDQVEHDHVISDNVSSNGKEVEAVLEKLIELAHGRRSLLDRMRKVIKVREICENQPTIEKIVGVDAGRNGANFRFAYIPIYAAAAILFEDGRVTEKPIVASGTPDVWLMEGEPERRENLLHMGVEYIVARKAVERWRPDLLLFDGALILNNRLIPRINDSDSYKRDFAVVIASSLLLLETCKRLRTRVVGFIKRTKLNHFSREMGFPAVCDNFLLNPIMRMGEMTEPISMDGYMVRICRGLSEELGINSDIITIRTSFIKTSNLPPYRVEMPAFCKEAFYEIASAIFHLSGPDGVPYPIHEADRYARITRAASNIHTLALYSSALDSVKTGRLKAEDLDLLIPQHGERWVLSDHLQGMIEP